MNHIAVASTARILGLVLLLALGACQPITLVGPDRVTVGGAVEVTTPVPWSRMTVRDNELWTVDGFGLQELRFAVGVDEGEALFAIGRSEENMPVFASDMTPLDVADLVVASLANAGYSTPTLQNLRPLPVGGMPGFRFDLSMKTKEGLEWDGFAVGAIREKRLHLVIYSGARLHYFGKHRADAERVVESIRFL